ncbi:hypothetical protein C8A00DRAFT_42400 [Chaetomidium leptoderma]|uniref:Uncharacterized protein n=1 Tax=Chaetomidium leptoderma TaxID=669021 RepID=A0AAN6VNM9_9PEZI|nr:hypothetical protein C8A00DRAFT_42400 [Chaetomidium leptoderma]
MGVQLEPISQTLEQHGPWHFGDIRLQQDHRAELEAALLQTASIPGLSDRLLEISKGSRADCHSPARPEVTLSVSKVSKPTAQGGSPGPVPPEIFTLDKTTSKPVYTLFPTALHPSLAFTQLAPSDKAVVTFPLPSPPRQPRPCLKRRRPDTDVDGPSTYSSGSKKRRLLRHLITSRLSQPFSLPATHILNREAAATGDKRFLKLTTIMSARRLNSTVTKHTQAPQPPQQPSPSTWLRRAAVLNSLRSRVYTQAAERQSAPVSDLAAKAAVFQQQGHPPTTFVAGRYVIDDSSSSNQHRGTGNSSIPRGFHGHPPTTTKPSSTQTLFTPIPRPGSVHHHHPGSPTATSPERCPTTANNHNHNNTTVTRHVRIPSPQLRPLRSPELRVTRPLVPLEDLQDLLTDDGNGSGSSCSDDDDDSMAFPTSEHESRYADDDDDEHGEGEEEGAVYADFSVIFGGGGSGGGGEEEEEQGGEDCFEDYMDDLDGIPWGGRC